MPEIPAASRGSHIWAAAIFIVTCAVGAWFWIGVNRATANPSIAILPFTGGDASLAAALTHNLTREFERNQALRVIPEDTAAEAKTYDLHKMSRMFYVDSVLRGEVARQGGKIRITAKLQRTTDRSTQWAGSWEGSENEISAAESEIVAGVVRSMRIPSRAAPPH